MNVITICILFLSMLLIFYPHSVENMVSVEAESRRQRRRRRRIRQPSFIPIPRTPIYHMPSERLKRETRRMNENTNSQHNMHDEGSTSGLYNFVRMVRKRWKISQTGELLEKYVDADSVLEKTRNWISVIAERGKTSETWDMVRAALEYMITMTIDLHWHSGKDMMESMSERDILIACVYFVSDPYSEDSLNRLWDSFEDIWEPMDEDDVFLDPDEVPMHRYFLSNGDCFKLVCTRGRITRVVQWAETMCGDEIPELHIHHSTFIQWKLMDIAKQILLKYEEELDGWKWCDDCETMDSLYRLQNGCEGNCKSNKIQEIQEEIRRDCIKEFEHRLEDSVVEGMVNKWIYHIFDGL